LGLSFSQTQSPHTHTMRSWRRRTTMDLFSCVRVEIWRGRKN
jgi:hypothetical protein